MHPVTHPYVVAPPVHNLQGPPVRLQGDGRINTPIVIQSSEHMMCPQINERAKRPGDTSTSNCVRPDMAVMKHNQQLI